MEEENKKGPKVSEVLELPSGILRAGQFFDNEAIAQRQSVEMVQDPTGSHRGRSLTADNPNPAALTRTPTTTTDGSTPTTSMPVSVAASKAQLPGLPSASRMTTPNTSATLLPGLMPELSGSNPDLLASVIPPTVYNGPGDAEFNEIIQKEVIELFNKCEGLFTPPVKKRIPKTISHSTDEKSSGGEKSGEEKTTPKKSRSGTGLEIVNKEIPLNKKELFQELFLKTSKAFLIKLNMMQHNVLYSRQGLAPFYTYFGINMGDNENNRVPLNSFSAALKPVVENAFAEHATAVRKDNFKKDCCMYTLMGVSIATSATAAVLSLVSILA